MRPCLIQTRHAALIPCSYHAVILKATAQRGRRERAVLCCGLEKNGMVRAWYGHSMASLNQTRPHCVNKMGKTHSKPLAARHGRGTAWARHVMCESALRRTVGCFRRDYKDVSGLCSITSGKSRLGQLWTLAFELLHTGEVLLKKIQLFHVVSFMCDQDLCHLYIML